MGTKNNPGTFDCYASAMPNEPMFILIGRDPDAPHLVRAWAHRRSARPCETTAAKVEEALTCADDMERFRRALAHFAAPEGGTLCGADITGRIPTSNPHDVTCPNEGTAVRTRAAAQKIVTGCPSCGHQTLFISEQGHLTCSWLQCREPGVEHAIESLKRGDDILDRIAQLPRRTIEFSGFALSDPPIKYDAVLLNDIGTLQKVD